jgi:nucleobase:cation symporter-1, NCS1 family
MNRSTDEGNASAAEDRLFATKTLGAFSHSGIEHRSIDYITSGERSGTARGQIPIWFMGQFQLVTLSLGFIGPSMGLSFVWSAVAAGLGTLLGTVFMSLLATQGPITGLPQMIQGRAQFGYRGVVIPLTAVLVDFIGYNVLFGIILSSGMHKVFGVNGATIVIVSAIVSAALAIYGYNWVHRAANWLLWINLPVFVLLTISCAINLSSGAVPAVSAGFNIVAFGTQLAAAASNAIAYSPFASDYTRYLRRDTPPLHIIGAVFAGSALSGFWMIGIGAWLASYLGAIDPITAIHFAGNHIYPLLGVLMAIIAASTNLVGMTMNTYSASLGVLTVCDSLRPTRPTTTFRVLSVLLVTLIWSLCTIAGGENVIGVVGLTLTVLLYVLVPWVAVTLVDFFLIRRRRYAVIEIFKASGLYGGWSWRGLLPYVVALCAMAPWIVLPDMYVGPFARAFAGVDIAWFVGIVVAGGLYWLIAPSVQHEAAAVAISERELEPSR